MLYYAKVNTAHPATGMITVGEYLTKKQAEALGAEKLEELVRRGVLGKDSGKAGEAPATTEEKPELTPEAMLTPEAEEERIATEAAEADAEEDLPVLDAADTVVAEPEAPAPRRKKGAKAK